jgi:MFS family permease
VGTLLGPNIARFLTDRGHEDGPWRLAAMCGGLLVVACFAIPFANKTGALFIAAAIVFLTAIPLGAIIAAMQNATHSRLRGMAGSLQTFSAQAVGYMISPTIIAMITDYVYGDPMMIGHSYQIVSCIAGVIAVYLFVTINRPYQAMLAKA